ncbi:cAMP responsive element modulator b isoform X2 [Colossoma macropomum]|uniref:cAMP responsive element modulator b isoform X2 n=1 Tax=Colossoma macropomum TaxID=42526 RepID=UPI0018655397|nr:cAMP responsive element modulator b isoform X2 [Colossoma macropomum]
MSIALIVIARIASGWAALHVEGRGRNSLSAPLHMAVIGEETESGTTGDMSAYQIRSPTSSLPQGVAMAGSPGSLHCPQQLAEEASHKRELRLMKNREAAKECRRRKREYVRCLETRVTMLELQNKKLISELQNMKEMYAGKSS